MKKEIYTKPEIEIIKFEEEDIMTASTSIFDPNDILGGDADGGFFE